MMTAASHSPRSERSGPRPPASATPSPGSAARPPAGAEAALAAFEKLHRPRLLLRAARFGLAEYRRERDLKRLLGGSVPAPARALDALLELEGSLDAARREGRVGYSTARHIEALIALMSEASLLRGGAAS